MCTGEQGHRERGGVGGYNDPGAHGLWGAHEAAHGLQKGSKGAHQLKFRNEHVKPFFGDHLILTEKTVWIPVKNFIFEIAL